MRSYKNVYRLMQDNYGKQFTRLSLVKFIINSHYYKSFVDYCINKNWYKEGHFLRSQKRCAYNFLVFNDLLDEYIACLSGNQLSYKDCIGVVLGKDSSWL